MGVLRVPRVCAIVAMLALLPALGHAQYFGRNKVEYHRFRLPHPDDRALRRVLLRARRARGATGGTARGAVVFADLDACCTTSSSAGSRSSSTAARRSSRRPTWCRACCPIRWAASPRRHDVASSCRLRRRWPRPNRVLGHEIVHAFQFDIARTARWHGAAALVHRGDGRVPRARIGSMPKSTLWLRDLVLSERVPRRHRDAARQLSPYQYGHAFWSYLGRRFGDDVVEKALKPDKEHRKLDDRMRYATGQDLETLYGDWRASCSRADGPARRTPIASAVEPAAHAAGTGAQPGRQAGGVLFRARSAVAGSVSRRRADRTHRPKAGHHHGEREVRQPAAASVGGRVESRWRLVRVSRPCGRARPR